MAKIAKQLTELVGNTPLLELNKYSKAKGRAVPTRFRVLVPDSFRKPIMPM